MQSDDMLYSKLKLRCGENGKFKVLLLSDAHAGVGFSAQLTAAVEALITHDRPDLVIFNGDTSGCGPVHVENADQLREMLAALTAPIEAAGIPWAHTFGNHDNNYGLENADAQPVYESFAHCVSKAGPADLGGTGNYLLPVYESGGGKVAFALWGMDSHRDFGDNLKVFGLPEDTQYVLPVHFAEGRGYDTVRFRQAMWYYNTSEALEERCGRKIPGLMFMHIPLPELWLVYNNREETGFEGTARETVACSELNSGLFMACLERGDVKAIVFGHDHISDFKGHYCGIELAYDAGIDYDCYQHDDLRGGRMYILDENDPWHFETYLLRVRDVMGKAGDKIKKD